MLKKKKIAKITSAEDENKHKCWSCNNIGTGAYFVYYKHMNCDKETGAKEIFNYQTTIY